MQESRITPPAAPVIALPKGGGAIQGIGEKFAANPVTGTGSISVPIAVSPGRSGFGPQLSLSYDSGAGDGPFGFGWTLSLPAITRKTDKGLPRYRDDEASDVYVLSGVEDLVPVLGPDGRRFEDEITAAGYRIHRYRPRIEGLFARIERWTRTSDGGVHWRSISKDNVLTVYGRDANSRIADPADSRRVFSWLICESRDDRGNAVVYEYKPEDGAGADLSRAHERNRGDRNDPRRAANRYLKHIRYGNRVSLLDGSGRRPRELTGTQRQNAGWMFEVVFDYGEHDASVPTPGDTGQWTSRADPFSTYRPGFEVRTCRLCRRILMFHHFPNESEVGADCLVRSTDFRYSHDEDPDDARNPVYTFLLAVTHRGYRRTDSGYLKRSLPSVTLGYSRPDVQAAVHEVDAESLENLPVGLDGAAYQWTDLHGEGIAGILTEQGGAWFYKRNLSPINIRLVEAAERIEAKFAPVEQVAVQPNLTHSTAGGSAQFMDLAGDGQPDLVVLEGSLRGFHEHDGGEGWHPFRSFTSPLNVDTRDPNLRLVDLDGDGHADVLITEDEAFVWHPSLGEAGFGSANRVQQAFDEEEGPRLVFADGTGSVHLADMNGDGLSDLVRIRNGEVCYWPNLGYGRFGAKITMDHAPHFDRPDRFDQRRLRLGDIDGSGTTDIIYLHPDEVRLFYNQCGNSWSAPQPLDVSLPIDDLVSVTAVDLLGNGTACLVWSSGLPGAAGRQMRYVNLMGGQKPHLLVSVSNNLGAETRIHYAPSTKFYLQDKRDGRPWITRLPFPVHVVERVETYDHVSRNRFVSRYAYHHGYFDGDEREFRGFGMVEQWDTEELGAITLNGVFPAGDNVDAASHVPPTHTRTWFHTGVYLRRDHIADFFAGLLDPQDRGEYYREPGLTDAQARALLLPDTALPEALSVEEEREACRALKGMMLRQEVYALDGTGTAEYPSGHPYAVTEQNFTVRAEQPRGSSRHAVFFTHAREVLTHHYERNPADPRVTHDLTLEVDRYGNVLRELAVAYGRRQSPLAEAPDRQIQVTPLITYTENVVTNAVGEGPGQPDDFRAPLLTRVSTFQLTGFTPENGAPHFSCDEWTRSGFGLLASAVEIPYEQEADGTGRQRRRIDEVRTVYRRNDLAALLPLGVLESQALEGQRYRLALMPGLIGHVFRRKEPSGPDEDLLPAPGPLLEGKGPDQGGYVAMDGGWWVPSRRVFFDGADVTNPATTAGVELAAARAHFYLPGRVADPFDQSTSIEYDEHDLLVIRTRDALDNTITAVNDYRVLQPWLVTDANRNRAAAAFDALGLVVATAVMGTEGEQLGDLLEDFEPDPPLSDLQAFVVDPGAHARVWLGKATTRIVYDLDRFQRCGQPPFAALLSREAHFYEPGGPSTRIQIGFSYSDGFAREIQRKVQAESGEAPTRAPDAPLSSGDVGPGDLVRDAQAAVVRTETAPRWVGTGRTVFNNKGLPVRRYEPFFAATHLYELEREMTDTGVSSILFYDPIGRLVATLHPNHTYDKVVFEAWRQTTWDVNDTVTLDPSQDDDVKAFFVSLPTTEYLPTWYALRTDPVHAAEAAQRWPDARLRTAERDAALGTAAHAGTPRVSHLDPLGRIFLTFADNGPDPAQPGQHVRLAERVELDIKGNERAARDAIVQNGDPLGRVVMRYDYDLLGHRIHQASMDAGERWMVADATGEPIRGWDSRGFLRRMTYDALRRPADVYLTEHGAERLAERTVYGESQGDATNHRTRVYEVRDAAGIVTSVEYDFKGNLRESRRELLADYRQAVDWRQNPPANEGAFTERITYDALDRPLTLTAPDGSVHHPVYNEANLLDRVEVNLRGAAAPTAFVTNIDYDAKGQRTRVAYQNGATTTYEYDPLTFRLVRLRTTRPPGANGLSSQMFVDATVVQNLRYTYDPFGNITRVEDAALETVVHAGQPIEPECRYTYDALYRLIEAHGREHIGQSGFELDASGASHRDFPFAGANAHPHDLTALRGYVERYHYDAAGNIETIRHIASGGNWTRSYEYAEASLIEAGKRSNRLTKTAVGNGINRVEQYGHDAHGNMTGMPHLPALAWDFKDQLQQADLGGGGRAYYTYDSGGRRVRKVIESQNGVRQKERLYVGGFEVYREFSDSAGAVGLRRESLHVMDDRQRVALVETQTIENGTTIGTPIAIVRYQLGNHLRSATMELADDAALISYEEYHPYGTPAFQAGRTGAEVRLRRYRYTGKERDEETGLDYFGARYYAPWLGRWTACDPMMTADGLDLYAFTKNSPINLVDLDGRFAYARSKEDAEIVRDALQRDVVKKQGTVYIEPHEDYVKVKGMLWGENIEARQIGFRVRIKLNDVAEGSNAENGSRTGAELLDLALNDPRSRIVIYPSSEAEKKIPVEWDPGMNATKFSMDICEAGCGTTELGTAMTRPAVLFEPDPARYAEHPVPQQRWNAERKEWDLPHAWIENIQGVVVFHEIVGHAYGMSLNGSGELSGLDTDQEFAILVEDVVRAELGLPQQRAEKPAGYNRGVGLEDLRRHATDFELSEGHFKRHHAGRTLIEQRRQSDLFGPGGFFRAKTKSQR